jgi:hypothetical protein
MRRSIADLALGILLVSGLGWAVWAGAPWLWPRLFPTPGEAPEQEDDASLAVEAVERAFDQALIARGGELPARPAGEARPVVALPRGMTPTALQAALRQDPRLSEATLYVTRADDLLWRLRVFDGARLILERDVRPWMSPAPPHPPGNAPELVVLLDGRSGEDAWVRRILGWRSPVAVVLQPFAPSTLRRADEAARASREVVAAIEPSEPLAGQLSAVPHAAAALIESELPPGVDPAAWLGLLAADQLVLIDGCPEGCFDGAATARAGVSRLRVAGRLTADEAEGVAEVALVRNLAVQRGYGVVLTDASKAGARRVEQLLEDAKADGVEIVFAAEAARQHRPIDP